MCKSGKIKRRKLFFYGSETMKKQLTPAWMLMYGYFFKSFSSSKLVICFGLRKLDTLFIR
jgi:hypothetical protein